MLLKQAEERTARQYGWPGIRNLFSKLSIMRWPIRIAWLLKGKLPEQPQLLPIPLGKSNEGFDNKQTYQSALLEKKKKYYDLLNTYY